MRSPVFTSLENEALRGSLRSHMRLRKLTQRQVADLLGVTQQMVSGFLTRRHQVGYGLAQRITALVEGVATSRTARLRAPFVTVVAPQLPELEFVDEVRS